MIYSRFVLVSTALPSSQAFAGFASYDMDYSGEPRAVSSMFAGSHHQSLHNPEFKVAGRDIHASTIAPTINVSFGLAHGTVSSGHASQLHSVIPTTIVSSGTTLASHKTQSPSPLAQFLVTLRRLILQDNSFSSNPPPEQVQIHSLNEALNEPPAYLTTPDIYVLNMLRTGKGLACWQPRPRKPLANKTGTVPGDVGIFTAEGGFKKLFNIWEDDEAVRATGRGWCSTAYQLPERDVVITESVLARGDAVAQGTSSLTSWTDDGQVIKSFEFECRSSQGAVLALTSPADLEEIADNTSLRKHITLNAELLYRHASTICGIANDEALYIITGSIKSESWALAAFNDPTTSSADVLRLMKRPGDQHPAPDFLWTHRATSEARVGRGEVQGTKDQSLFLRGFKLDFSDAFRARMDTVKLSSRSADPEASRRSSGASSSVGSTGTTLGGTSSSHSPFEGNVRSSGSQASTRSPVLNVQRQSQSGVDLRSDSAGQDVRVTSLTQTSSYGSNHPCDIINRCMLEHTDADFALSHDDDWRELLRHFESNGIDGSRAFREDKSITIDKCMSYEKGVARFDLSAILVGAGSDAASTESRLSPSASHSAVITAGPRDIESGNFDEALQGTPKYVQSTHTGGSQRPFDVGLSSQRQDWITGSREYPLTYRAGPPTSSYEDLLEVVDGPVFVSEAESNDADLSGFESYSSQIECDFQLGGQSSPDLESELRQELGLRPDDPISLWSLPDPEPGQRPPHSYPLMCKLAIYGSPSKRLTLKGIYDAIEERFQYYRSQPKGVWKGSIRHNLSLNQEFKNVLGSMTGSDNDNYWEILHIRGDEGAQTHKGGKATTDDDSRGGISYADYIHADPRRYDLEVTKSNSAHLKDIAGPSTSPPWTSRRSSASASPSAPTRELKAGPTASSPPGVRTRKPVSHRYLAKALQLAHEAVQLDSESGSRDAAIRLYEQSVSELRCAIESVLRRNRKGIWTIEQEDEIQKLQSIRGTYLERIAVLKNTHNTLETPSGRPSAPSLTGIGLPAPPIPSEAM